MNCTSSFIFILFYIYIYIQQMYPTLTPVGKPSLWYHKKKTRNELYHELSEKEKQIEVMKSREIEVKTSLREQHDEEGEEEEAEEEEEEEEEEEVEEVEETDVPSDLYHSILSESVETEDASLSYMYGSMQDDDDEDDDSY
ncbi:hypothetical protein K501DRAFT_99823 [Backusella circina FSU 941]|nr:hypothetical protein K501DRAFT_99823 [Backusella circina FSU 941]